MQVRDVKITKYTNHVQNIYETFTPLNRILKIFSLNNNFNITTSDSSFVIAKCVICTVVLSVCNFYTLYFKINNVYSVINASIKLTDAIQMVYDFFQYIVDLVFVFKYGRHKIIGEYFQQYENIDRILGVSKYSTIKMKLVRLIGVFVIFWVFSSLVDFTAWVLSFGWVTSIIYSVAYIYILIKILTTLDLNAHVMHVECRLCVINGLLRDCYRSTEPMPSISSVILHGNSWLHGEDSLRFAQSYRGLQKNTKYDVKWLTRCYLMLIEQTKFINQMFGIRIVLNSLSLLIDMIRFLNLAIRIFIGSQLTTYNSSYFPAVSSLLRLLICVAIVISLVHHCESVYRENDKILNSIDHILIDQDVDEKLSGALTELRDLVQSRPICFNMANFINLNYSLLLSIASVVVTYTIILLQSVN